MRPSTVSSRPRAGPGRGPSREGRVGARRWLWPARGGVGGHSGWRTLGRRGARCRPRMRESAESGLPGPRKLSALAWVVGAEPGGWHVRLRAAPVRPERGCKAQASARACPRARPAAPRSGAGGRRGFCVGAPWPPRWWRSLLLDSWLLLFPVYLASLAPCWSCLFYHRKTAGNHRPSTFLCVVLVRPAVSENLLL